MSQKLSQTFQPFDIDPPPKLIFNSIRLNPGITLTNFLCSQLHYMIMVFAFGMSDTLQPLILLDKSYYNADAETAGSLIALILFIQLFVKISVSVFYGHWCDKLGRKPVLYFGTLSVFIGMLLAPCFSTIFPGFMIAKVFVSNGASAIATLPLNADYIHDESKGRVAGITVTLNALGALASNLFLKYLLYSGATLGKIYWISGFIVLFAFVLNSFGLKGGKYYLTREEQRDQLIESPAESKSIYENFKEASKVFKENAWLSIALALQILGNADFYLAFTILALYVKSLFPLDTDDRISNIAVNNVQSFIFIPTLFSNISYGCYIDKTRKVMNVIVVALTGGAVGFLMTSAVNTASDTMLYVAAFVIGSTITGVYVSSNYLCFTHYPREKRGIMHSVTVLVGYIGYVIIASGGGYLFDNWRKSAPFVMYAGLSFVALVWVVRIYRTRLMH